MNARKLKIETELNQNHADVSVPAEDVKAAEIKALGRTDVKFVPSPARQLQEQLEDQLGNSAALQPAEKYSGLTSLAIIAGSATALWAIIAFLGYALIN